MVDNTVTLIGTITRDLELRHTPAGNAVVDIGIAQNKRIDTQMAHGRMAMLCSSSVLCGMM